MKMIAPNIARPIRKPSDTATLKTGIRNRLRGMIGSGARRSWNTNAPISRTPTIASAMIVPEPQRYSLPPQVVTRIRQETPAVSSAAPRKSILWRWCGTCRCSLKTMMITAKMPIGTFT